jgi:hypothetical protein
VKLCSGLKWPYLPLDGVVSLSYRIDDIHALLARYKFAVCRKFLALASDWVGLLQVVCVELKTVIV